MDFCICTEENEKNKIGSMDCIKCDINMHVACLSNITSDTRPHCIKCSLSRIFPFDNLEYELVKPQYIKPNSTPKTTIIFNVKNMKQYSKNKFAIFCIRPKPKIENSDNISWPSKEIHFNRVKYSCFQREPIFVPTIESNNSIVFSTNSVINNTFILAIYAIKTKSLGSIRVNESMEYKNCKQQIIDLLTDQCAKYEKISINDVYTNNLIKYPVRGIYCEHVQSFDLMVYLKLNLKKKSFKCPICNNFTYPDDMFYDQYTDEIIKTLSIKYNEDELASIYVNIEDNGKLQFIIRIME